MAHRLARQRQVMGSVTRAEEMFEIHWKKFNVAAEGPLQLKWEMRKKEAESGHENHEETMTITAPGYRGQNPLENFRC